VANLKQISIALAIVALISYEGQIAHAQCSEPVVITLGNVIIDPCTPQRVSIPVYMTNPCPVGGLEFRFNATAPWLNFTPGDAACADTFGSRISDWEMFSGNVHAQNPAQIVISGIADMPGGDSGIYLPPGDGLIFTMHLDYNNNLVCDSSQVFVDSVGRVADPTGYVLYPVEINMDTLVVAPGPCGDNQPRGDANNSCTLNGLDVTYLVAFFKGTGPGFCCLCAGDANSSGAINGLDVTYLVGYFKGYNPPLEPCH
jgi:hypothetical protein